MPHHTLSCEDTTTYQIRKSLPPEVIERIVYSIDDSDLASTLFALLTVNKTVFALAIERLYTDIFRSLASCDHVNSALQRLLVLISQVCPDEDPALLSHLYNVMNVDPPLSTTPTTNNSDQTDIHQHHNYRNHRNKPYADYFSFVRVINVRLELLNNLKEAVHEGRHQQRRQPDVAAAAGGVQIDNEDEEQPVVDSLECLECLEPMIWMACGRHRLPNVRQVSLNITHLAPYSRYIQYMAGIELMTCRFSRQISAHQSLNPHIISSTIKSQIKELKDILLHMMETRQQLLLQQRLHQMEEYEAGPHQGVEEIHRQRKPFNIQLLFHELKGVWYQQEVLQPLRDLFTVLHSNGNAAPIDAIYHDDSSEECDPNWVLFYVMPECIDLAGVRLISQYGPGYMEDIVLKWPQQLGGKPAILQQCRSLRHLEIYVEDEGEDATLFAWARDERQQLLTYSSSSCTSGGRTSIRAMSPPPSSSTLNPFQRCVSLETLHIGMPWGSTMEHSLHDALFAFRPTLQRIRLDAGGMEIDLSLFADLPALRELEIDTGVILCSLTGSSSTFSGCPRLETITLQEDGDGEIRDIFDVWRLPNLRKLSLTGAVAYHFNQETLAVSGGLLQELTMFSEVMGQWPAETAFKWDVRHWCSLPNLRKLHLGGSMSVCFRVASMLRCCPNLGHLELAGPMDVYHRTDCSQDLSRCFESDLPREESIKEPNENGLDGIAARASVMQLELSGWSISDKVLDVHLPATFPALQQLRIRASHPETVSQERCRAIQAKFPNLVQVNWR